MHETVIRLPLTSATVPLISDLTAQHREVMKQFPDLGGASAAPRADLQVLFRADLPGEPGITLHEISLALRSGLRLPGSQGTVLPVLGETLDLQIRLVTEKRLSQQKEGKRVITKRAVSDEEIEAWTSALLARHGFSLFADSLQCSSMTRRGLMKSVNFNSRELLFKVKVVEQVQAQVAWLQGVGRGKSYGFGMLSRTA